MACREAPVTSLVALSAPSKLNHPLPLSVALALSLDPSAPASDFVGTTFGLSVSVLLRSSSLAWCCPVLRFLAACHLRPLRRSEMERVHRAVRHDLDPIRSRAFLVEVDMWGPVDLGHDGACDRSRGSFGLRCGRRAGIVRVSSSMLV